MALRLKANRRFPSVPVVTDNTENHTQVLMAVKEALDIGQRRTGDLLNSFIRVEDLIDLGLITIEGNTQAIVGADLSEIANIGDLSGAAEGDFLRFRSGEWVNDDLLNTDITQVMVTQHEAALDIDWSQLDNVPALVTSLAALSDPGNDRIVFWDESANALAFLTVGTGLSITGTTLAASGGGAQYLDDLLDVDALYPDTGDVLTFDGAEWINSPASEGGGGSSLIYVDGSVPASNTIANTSSETTFTSQKSISLAQLAEGSVIRFEATGTYSTDAAAAPTLRLRAKLDSTTVLDTTAFTTTVNMSNRGWSMSGALIVTTSGSSGQVEAQGQAVLASGATSAQNVFMPNTAKVAVNMSGSRVLTITGQWGTADADNTITMRQLLVYHEQVGETTVPQADALYDLVVANLHFDGADGSTTFTDEKGHTFTGSGNAQISTSSAKWGGSSLRLDGTDDYITAPDHADWSFGSGDWTVDCWVRFSGDPGTGLQTFVSHYDAAGNQRGWAIGLDNNTLRLLYSTDGTGTTILSTAWNPAGDTWYYVSVVRYGANVYFFVDGVLLGSASIGSDSIFDANTTLQIGTQSNGADGDVNGWIDDVRITLAARYITSFTLPDQAHPNFKGDTYFDSVISLLHFEGADGSTTFTDVIPARNWTNGGSGSTAEIDTAQFKFGASSLFDQTRQSYISTPDAADLDFGTGDFTIELWIRPSALNDSSLFWDQRSASGTVAPAMYYMADGSIRYHPAGVDRITSATGVIVANTWKHIAVCRSGTSTKMFVDGQQVGSTYTDSNDYVSGPAVLGNAGDALSSSFGHIGHIDEVRITKGVARYADNFPPLPVAFSDSFN